MEAPRLDADWSEERRTAPMYGLRASAESGIRRAVPPDATPAGAAALLFMEASAKGWGAADLVAWCHTELFPRSFVTLRNPVGRSFQVKETGVGFVELPTSPSEFPFRATTSLATRIVEVARGKVIDSLRKLTVGQPDDHFVRAALYGGHVHRVNTGRQSSWGARLREGEPLHQWVLALFAADALTDRDRYEQRLFVCDRCSAVGFGDGKSRGTCDAHRVEAQREWDPRRRSVIPAAHVTVPEVPALLDR